MGSATCNKCGLGVPWPYDRYSVALMEEHLKECQPDAYKAHKEAKKRTH
jgi:hypothetical protein